MRIAGDKFAALMQVEKQARAVLRLSQALLRL
jgi:hypothetical protein